MKIEDLSNVSLECGIDDGYNQAIDDQIRHLDEEIKKIKENI